MKKIFTKVRLEKVLTYLEIGGMIVATSVTALYLNKIFENKKQAIENEPEIYKEFCDHYSEEVIESKEEA